MPTLIDNLNLINSYKSDIKTAIEEKGVDMTGVTFSEYANAIGQISGGGGTFVTSALSVSQNGTYYPEQGVDGFSQVTVSVAGGSGGYSMTFIIEGGYKRMSELSDPYAETVTSYLFFEVSDLTMVSLPNCTLIEVCAFNTCGALESVYCPNCEEIQDFAFFECQQLASVEVDACVTCGYNAFGDCFSLESISLPACDYIGEGAFATCCSLSEVYIPICNYIGVDVFIYCTSLTTIWLNLGSSVCEIANTDYFADLDPNISIYVPMSLLADYRVANNWSDVASHLVGWEAGPQ